MKRLELAQNISLSNRSEPFLAKLSEHFFSKPKRNFLTRTPQDRERSESESKKKNNFSEAKRIVLVLLFRFRK